MLNQPFSSFDPRQKMLQPDFEIVHKWDTDLKDVELHHHDFYEVNFLISGDVTYVIESRVYRMRPGDMLIINPRELHQVYIKSNDTPYERYMLWISPSYLQQLSSGQTDLCRCFDMTRPHYGNLLYLSAEQKRTIPTMMESILQEQKQAAFGWDLLRQSRLTELMIHINRLADSSHITAEAKPSAASVVTQVIDYINSHYQEQLSLDMLAERFFVSKYHLSHEFNKQMGTGIYQYIQKKRLLIARQLMAQGQKPVEVYAACGFGDYPAFFRAFRKVYGLSPRAYVQSLGTNLHI
ncbi:MAG: AraC family transcriptional regulator [Ruminococcaceae bacterium]|nr:AraC family transcriptional regulator [Oscillospiraceae bacterium]